MDNSSPQPPSDGWRVSSASFLRAVRMFLLLVVIILVIVFGLTFFQQQAVLPANVGLARIALLSTRVAEAEATLTENDQHLFDLQSQNAVLEVRVQTLLGEMRNLQQRLNDQDQILAQIEHISQPIPATGGEEIPAQFEVSSLQQQVDTLKVLAILSRARLYLTYENDLLAAGQVRTARSILEKMQPSASPEQQATLVDWIGLLDVVLENIANDPAKAVDSLDSGWQAILAGLPASQPAAQPAQTPTPTKTPTAQP